MTESARRTIKLTLAYDGTEFSGWARQPGARTVQGELEAALGQVCAEQVQVLGASRTDAGVHALGQVASFETAGRIPTERLPAAVNGLLPASITVVKAEDVSAGFHPSHDTVSKLYRYRLHLGPRAPVQTARFVWPVKYPLDLERMQAAAAVLLGEHDFTSFAAAADPRESKVRTILGLTVVRRPSPVGVEAPLDWSAGDEVHLDVRGTGFLYHMVRNIVGTLVDLGRQGGTPDQLAAILAARDRCVAGQTAPACGLCLMRVWYPEPSGAT